MAGFGETPRIVASSPNVSAVFTSLDHTGYGGVGSDCVLFDPPIAAERVRAAVVTGFYGPNDPVAVASTTYCKAGEVGVLLYDFSTTGPRREATSTSSCRERTASFRVSRGVSAMNDRSARVRVSHCTRVRVGKRRHTPVPGR